MKHDETPRPRGFAAMTPQRRSEIARLGGLKAQRLQVAHRWVAGSVEAIEAGRKGGLAKKPGRRKITLGNNKS